MPYLAKSYGASVASYLTSKLGVTYFLNHPVYYIYVHRITRPSLLDIGTKQHRTRTASSVQFQVDITGSLLRWRLEESLQTA